MPITKGFRVLVDEAMAQVRTLSVPEVLAMLDDPQVQIVDIRDVRELKDGRPPPWPGRPWSSSPSRSIGSSAWCAR